MNFAMVGAFVLILGAALVGGVLWLSSGRPYGTAYDTYQAYLRESVAGLNLNAPVRYHGVDVGRVRKIALAPGDVEQVQLTLALDRGTPVKTDTMAVLQTQGLTGIAYVELQGGSRDSPPLRAREGEPYPVIQAGPSLMVRLDASLSDAAVALKGIARLSEELPNLAARIRKSADIFDRMSNDLARAGTEASAKFTGETLPEAHQLMADLRSLTASLRRVSNELEQNPSVLLYGRPAGRRGPGE